MCRNANNISVCCHLERLSSCCCYLICACPSHFPLDLPGPIERRCSSLPAASNAAPVQQRQAFTFEYGAFNPHVSHLLEPRSRREFALDMPPGGEKVMGEEKPERGSPAED